MTSCPMTFIIGNIRAYKVDITYFTGTMNDNAHTWHYHSLIPDQKPSNFLQIVLDKDKFTI